MFIPGGGGAKKMIIVRDFEKSEYFEKSEFEFSRFYWICYYIYMYL